MQVGEDRLAVGIAHGDQAGSPPAGHLADLPTQRALTELGSAELGPQPTDRPPGRSSEQPADALAKAGTTQPRPAHSWPVGKPAGAVGVVAVNPAAHRRRAAAQKGRR
jgi:hypothetical protein